MNCERAMKENVIERYLAGALEPALKEEWEQHYFACKECAERLETWQTIEKPLRDMAPEIRRKMAPRPAGLYWRWIAAAVAAILLIGVGVLLRKSGGAAAPTPPPVVASRPSEVMLLARLEPPAYAPAALRGIETPAERQFRSAMDAYQQRDWPHAIDGLKSATELDPPAPAPRFFLGACYLLNGNSREGVVELERVATGNSPFAEEARFDLAKGYLALGRTDEALAMLRKIAKADGDFAAQSNTLIGRIQGAR
jgi:tetratricopeptide (TPR) repeat protein